MSKKYDIISIGDLTSDAFIKLKDAKVTCDVNHESCMISMRFGDKIPYEDVKEVPAVGNSANAAFSAVRLGLKSALVSHVGDDRNGEEAVETLKGEGVGVEFVKAHRGMKTNYHYVLSFDGERTILVKHEEFPYKLPAIGRPGWIYLSSMGEHDLVKLHGEVEKYLDRNKDVKMAFQPGTFQMKVGTKRLAGTYKRSEVVFMNKEEAQKVLKTKEEKVKKLLDGLCELGTKVAVITDGREGAYARDGRDYWHMPIYPDPKPPLERTGAGDAFSSTFIVALVKGMSVEEALMWGPINSMSVVQYIGAREGLLSEHKLKELLRKAPRNYKPTRI
ncbi:MAG: carbohydrate kinase family protein [bacterium]|nr:carbohydrate kinase family protein [bacterium]